MMKNGLLEESKVFMIENNLQTCGKIVGNALKDLEHEIEDTF